MSTAFPLANTHQTLGVQADLHFLVRSAEKLRIPTIAAIDSD